MLRNYFKTAWRNLAKNKFYSLINILGLTVGLTVGIMILVWVQDELSFDTFNSKSSGIYRLQNQGGTGASVRIWTVTTAPIGPMAKKELPVVKEAVRLTYDGAYTLFRYKDKVFNENNTQFTDPSLFSVFDFPLIKGNQADPFPDPYSVVITASTARRYFGDEEPIGKVLAAKDNTHFTVSGVINDLPLNSSIQFDMFFPMKLLAKMKLEEKEDMETDFRQFNFITFLQVQPGTRTDKLESDLRNIHLRNKPDDDDVKYLLQPLSKMHLYNADGSDRGISTVRIFSFVALLILTIACINYVNLSTARSMLRAKEVSMRKIVGADKWQLFLQFIVETAVMFLLSTLLAIGLIQLIMPLFNELSGKQLALDLANRSIWMVIAATIAGTLVASSIYPALLLSSFEPIKILRGKIAARINDALFRKMLVVTQFVFSVGLIIGTLIINRQLNFIRSKQLGYDKEHVLVASLRGMAGHYEAVKNSLIKAPGVHGVTRSNGDIVWMGQQTGNNDWEGKAPGQTFLVYTMSIDQDFIPFFKMTMAEGSNFTGSVSDSTHFILNETAVKQAGIKDPIGKRFKMWELDGTITGVVKDFHFASMRSSIQPAVFYYQPQYSNLLFVKTTGRDAPRAIESLAAQYKKYNPEYPYTYRFLDDTFNDLYRSETRTATLFRLFAGVAILISCLGLLGLAAYTAQVRTREIGIRKVLGASVSGIVHLLARDFIKLVLIAIIIAIPVAWYAMNSWLQDFVYRIDMGWIVFVLGGLIAVVIAIITISFQAIRAALANPVKNLRTE